MNYPLFHRCLYTVLCAACLLVNSPEVEGQALRQLTDFKNDWFRARSIDNSGTLVVAATSADLVGSNPEHAWQIFKWEWPGGACTQLTSFAEGVGYQVSVSDGDHWLAFNSPSDPLGTNPDHSYELFMMQLDGSGLAQLTDDSAMGGGEVSWYVEISGTANKILFQATLDPLGTNPDHISQLFVIDTDTQVVTQLTQGIGGYFEGISISDAGDRVVFSHWGDHTGANPDGSYEIFKVDADGQNLTQITSSSTTSYHDPMISGNGQVIVFASGQIYMALWNSPTPVLLTTGYEPSVTYAGAWIYYVNYEDSQLYKIPRTGGTPIQLTSTSSPFSYSYPMVSGGDSRVIFISEGGEHPGGNNPDGGQELMVMDTDGTDIQQLTVVTSDSGAAEPDISADGTRVAYVWDVGYPGDIHVVDAYGSNSILLAAGPNWHPTLTGDGETVVFTSDSDLTGEANCPYPYYRNVYQIQSDGTGLLWLSDPDSCAWQDYPVVAANGSRLVFQSNGIFDGVGTGEPEIFSMPLGGGPVTQISNDGALEDGRKNPRISADGEWAVWHYLTPGVLLRGRTDGSLVETLGFDSWRPDISGDGQLVVFDMDADPLGTNIDLNREIFLYDTLSDTLQQLTFTSGGNCDDPQISADGAIVYFLSSSEIFGPEPGNFYRVHVSSGLVERAGGPCSGWIIGQRTGTSLAVDADGSRAVFTSYSDLTGDNLDRNSEVWLVDYGVAATVNPSQSAPTYIEWDPDPRAVRYDVIRGNVANLAAGMGGTVDLGMVVCLEDDSVDNSTLGNEDVAQPASGQVFFFLYRGTQGILDGPGSYGQGTGGAERIVASGDCTP